MRSCSLSSDGERERRLAVCSWRLLSGEVSGGCLRRGEGLIFGGRWGYPLPKTPPGPRRHREVETENCTDSEGSVWR